MNLSREDRQARAAEEAAAWLEKLERTITIGESRALRRWLKPAMHREAIVHRCKLWHGPEILAVLGELIPVETFAQRVERHYGRMVLAIFLAVSGIGLVLIAFSKIWPGSDDRQNPLRADADLRTSIGERKTIQLPDGGSIVMNTATRLLLHYRPHSRDATLLRGEATFAVKNDPARPFVVFAGSRRFEVQADGATFNVYRATPDTIDLMVVQGRIRVPAARSTGQLSPALLRSRVSYGEHMFSATEGGTLGNGWQMPRTLHAQELDRRLAWHRGRVVFDGEPIDDVIDEMRYTTSRFRAANDELREMRVSGEFDTSDIEGFLRRVHAQHSENAEESSR